VVLAGAFATIEPFRVAVQTAVLVPELVGQGPRLLSVVSAAPRRDRATFGTRADPIESYHPDGTGRRPAVLLVLGVRPFQLDDPRVVRVATALARLGLVVGLPGSPELDALRIDPSEPSRVVEAFEYLVGRPDVDPDRVGIAGFSVGASLALVAAADERIDRAIAYVNTLGAYADAAELLAEVGARRVDDGGVERPWLPTQLTRTVFLELVVSSVGDAGVAAAIRDRLGPIVAADAPPSGSWDPAFAAGLSGDAAAIYRLATAPDLATARDAVASLSEARRAELRAVSPSTVADRIRAPIFAMHDESDPLIPHAHLARLEAALPAGIVRRATSFRLFDHVEPRSGLGTDAWPELWKLFWHLQTVLAEAL
jgi:ABC-2 type transport system ATP-binding protein